LENKAVNIGSVVRRLSPFTISFLIHASLLLLFSYITWGIPTQKKADAIPITITMMQKEKSVPLRLPEKMPVDRVNVRVKDRLTYSVPENDYRPNVPEIKFRLDSRTGQGPDIIGIEAIDGTLINTPGGRKTGDPHALFNTRGGGQGLYTGEEKVAGSFSRHVEELREEGLDIVFIFDSTSSMAGFLRQIKIKIANMITTFKKLVPEARIGLVTFRDVGDDFVTKSHQLTHGTGSLQNFLKDIDPVGGGDEAEALDEGLRVAIENLNWNAKSKKIILLIGDAPPHQKDMENTIRLIEKFRKKMGGVVSTLDTSAHSSERASGGEQKKVLDEFKLIADIGGGESSRLVDEEKVIKQMVLLAFGTRWEEYLDEFLKNL
jgi:Mg-chelatase subunit ChlD